jgi:hypothetical protein
MRIGRDKSGQQDVVYGITDAHKPLSQDIRSRESKYLIAMGIRVAAFLLIVILPIAWPWKIGLAVLALALPYIAVVYANGGREPEPGADSMYRDPARRALMPGSGAEPGTDRGADPGTESADGEASEPIAGRIAGDDD